MPFPANAMWPYCSISRVSPCARPSLIWWRKRARANTGVPAPTSPGPARRIQQPLSRLTSSPRTCSFAASKPTPTGLSARTGLPTPEEAMKLSISPGDHVSRFHRLRRADGVPMAIELAVIPQHYLPDPASVCGGSLYEALDARGVQARARPAAPACDRTHRTGSPNSSTCRMEPGPGTVHRAPFPICPMAALSNSPASPIIAATAMTSLPNSPVAPGVKS